MTPLFAFALSLLVPASEPLRIAAAPLVVAAPCKFAGPDVEQTRRIIAAAYSDYLQKACDATDMVCIDPIFIDGALERTKIDFAKEGNRKREKLQEFGKAADAAYAVVAVVEWTEQKNADLSAIAAQAARPASTTKVRLRIWLQNVADDLLRIDGAKQAFGGEAKGPYFGTVNPRDMSGDPVSKNAIIQNEYRQRAKWLGRATVQGVRAVLAPILGLKDPPSPFIGNR